VAKQIILLPIHILRPTNITLDDVVNNKKKIVFITTRQKLYKIMTSLRVITVAHKGFLFGDTKSCCATISEKKMHTYVTFNNFTFQLFNFSVNPSLLNTFKYVR
jgi:hypothetical protein